MIYFNFKLEDADAENLFSLIGNAIADNHMKIQTAMIDNNQALIDAYKKDIEYLSNLKLKLTNTNVEVPVNNKLYVCYNSPCVLDQEPIELYGDWHFEFQFTVTNVSIDKPEDDHESFTVDFNPIIGEKVFVLVMIFTTGDSFGCSTGNGEIIWTFSNIETATHARTNILEMIDSQTLNFKTETGTIVKMSNPAYGYFETCTSLTIQEFTVQ